MNLSFLKKAGQIIANIGLVEAGLEPIFKNTLPQDGKEIDKIDLIFKSIIATEGQFVAAFPSGQMGKEKLLAAASLVGPVLGTVDTIRGRAIQDEAAYVKAVQTITEGIADLMNSLKTGLPTKKSRGIVSSRPLSP